MFKVFRTPYLDGDDGANLGGGGSTEGQQTSTSSESTTSTGGQQQSSEVDFKPFLDVLSQKAKFNHQPVKIESIDDVVNNYQKGMNYDRIYPEYEKLRSDPSRSFVETMAKKNNMSVPQYLEAVKQSEEQERMNELVQKNIPPEFAKEMLENRKFREQYETTKKEIDTQKAREKDYADFTEWHTKTYGKEPNPAEIPEEVWKAVGNGTPLRIAFIEHDYGNLRGKIQQSEQSQQTQQANQKNAESSTGSVKSKGPTGGFISSAEFDANKSNRDWIQKNLKTIEESRKRW